MKTRAAVAFASKTSLEIVELDLEGPNAGEVLVEIMAMGSLVAAMLLLRKELQVLGARGLWLGNDPVAGHAHVACLDLELQAFAVIGAEHVFGAVDRLFRNARIAQGDPRHAHS